MGPARPGRDATQGRRRYQALVARELELVDEQDHARIGAPPEDRLAAVVPGENAMSVRIAEALGRQVPARRQQPVRIIERGIDRRKQGTEAQPRNHGSILPVWRVRFKPVVIPAHAGIQWRRAPFE